MLNLEKDKKGGVAKTHNNSFKVVQEFMENLDLTNAWRVLHPDSLRYTWRRRKPEIQCRLDFFLVSQSLMCNVMHKILGVRFSTNPDLTAELNYNVKLTKIKNSLSCWECRRLTLYGKITVLKSLIASQLVYILSPLTTNHRVLKEINSLFYDFFMERQRRQNQE